MTSYKTNSVWVGEHWGHLTCSNGAEFDFSAPKAVHGHAGVMTPEDGVVGSLNMCYQLMFLWAAERAEVDLVSYECEAEGFVQESLDQTSTFSKFVLRPRIVARNTDEQVIGRVVRMAYRYSLVAQSVKGEVIVEPNVTVE
ncbi:MAG: OsmC family protein [Chloroflexi bacterium]|nr:OsmC family protein [Chloroflexota bacterium]